MNQKLIVLCGNIGTGKSSFAKKYCEDNKDTSVVSLDAITTMIHGGNYDMYREDWKPIYKSVHANAIETLLSNRVSVIIDDTNMDAKRRISLISVTLKYWYYSMDKVCYDFGAGNIDSLNRRKDAPKGIDSLIWDEVHKRLYDQYELPTIKEGFNKIISMKNGHPCA